MELAVDAAQSRNLPGFLERFAERAARMLNAKWGGVMVFRGREIDLYQGTSHKQQLEPSHHSVMIRLARENRRHIQALALQPDVALDGPTPDPGTAVIVVPITASDEESLGSLCLLRDLATLEKNERILLHALASHAGFRNSNAPSANGSKISTLSATISSSTTALSASFERIVRSPLILVFLR
jgi:hypothetical protein